MWGRLRGFRVSADPGLVAGADAAREIAWAQRLTPRGSDLPAVAPAVAVAWLRYLVLPAGPDREALAWAVGLALPVYPAAPASVPRYLHAVCAEIISQPADRLLDLLAGWHAVHDPNKEIMLAEMVQEMLESEPELRARGNANLAELLMSRPTLKRLQVAIIVMRWSIEATAPGDPDHAERLNRMSLLLRSRWDLTGQSGDLDDAIGKLREAIELASADAARCASYRANLSGQLQLRYLQTAQPHDLDEALDEGRQAANAVTGNAGIEHNYGGALGLEYQRTGDAADLDAALDREHQALRYAPPGTAGRDEILSSIGVCLRLRHSLTLNRADLDESIQIQRAAIDETAGGNQVGRAIRLGNLAAAVSQRYGQTEQLSDLADVIKLSHEALDLIPDHHGQRGLFLSNYGGALRARFERAKDPADLNSALDYIAEAVSVTPDEHPRSTMYLTNLAAGYHLKYRLTRDRADLSEAAVAADLAVQSAAKFTEPGLLAAAYATRGAALSAVYERTDDADTLAAAVHDCVQAVQLTPEQSPRYGSYSASLASVLLSHANRTDDETDRAAALEALRAAAAGAATPTSTRILTAQAAARLCAKSGDWDEAADFLVQAVRLLPLTAPRELQLSDQENWLGKFGDLAADAAACAIEAGRTADAVSCLELGRGILLGRAIQLRSAVAELRAAYPGQADRFEQLRAELDAPVATPPQLSEPAVGDALAAFDADHAIMTRRRDLAAELDRLIAEIRELPGLADFMRPPSATDLTAVAAIGPVVFINVSSFRSDALILRQEGVRLVRLTSLTPEAVADHVTALTSAVRASATATGDVFWQAQEAVRRTLAWLWEALAEPVLGALDYTTPAEPGMPWPRVWWAPVGLLSYLPIHAAGRHGDGTMAVLNRVVSSYTPTVYALAESRKRQHQPTAEDTMLVIAMPTTPGARDLRGAGREADMLTTRFPAVQALGSWPQAATAATKESVTVALPVHAFAHFACHANCDLALPSQSALLVSDHETDPLTIADIADLNLGLAQLAYLSACETAMTSSQLTNEALHLVTAFSLAGYPHVIGTLWKVDDSAAYSIALRVYGQLAPAEGTQPQAALTAHALHAAVHAMRDRFAKMPTAWAAHIHSGA